jgi:hypothetical protein
VKLQTTMNVYLDTNIIYQDPFFTSFLGQLIIERAKAQVLKIYIPEVVLKEARQKIIEKEQKLKQEIRSQLIELSSLQTCEFDFDSIEKLKIEEKFNTFFSEQFENKIFHLLPCDISHYEKSLQLAVEKKAPFFIDKRSEFRDSLIWQTISGFVRLKKGEKHYFITRNYQDFWNREKTGIHPEIKADAPGLVIFESIKKIFDSVDHLILSKSKKEFEQWFKKQDVSIASLQKALSTYLWNHIVNSLSKNIQANHINDLYPEIDLGFVKPILNSSDFHVLEIGKIEIRDVYAQIEVKCVIDFVGEIHLPNYDKGDFSNTETSELNSELIMTVAFDKDLFFSPISITIVQIGFNNDASIPEKE